MKRIVFLFIGLFVLAGFFAFRYDPAPVASSLPKGQKFLDPSNIDPSVAPGDDFYTYANGTWLKNTPIPASKTRWGSFNLLEEFNQNALKGLLEDAMKIRGAKKGSPEQMVGDCFASGMDSIAIEKAGLTPLQNEFDRINAITNSSQLLDELARKTTIGLNPVFRFNISPDDKNVSRNVCNLMQRGLGLPDRDYYLKDQKREKELREKYILHIAKTLTLGGESPDNADNEAKIIMQLETDLARASMDRVSMRNPETMYNKYSVAAFSAKTPGIDWKKMLGLMHINNEDTLLVATPDFFVALANRIQTTPIDHWKIYLKWHLLRSMSPYLNSALDQEHFRFYGTALRGQQEQEERWKRVLDVVDGAVGEQLGKMYTDKYFTAEAKKRMMELVNNLEAAFETRINQLDWMSETTKGKAKEKLHAFIKKIGYPDRWRDYKGLEITRDSYVKNILASNAYDYQYMIAKLGKPVDRSEWMLTPPTVNAYYNPAFNEIVFPAGILQYPFFDLNGDDAVIYGAIGAVIGHEMTHGFDDQGCQYAADGNLKNWWTEKDKNSFDSKTKMVREQYDAYTILDDQHVNGALTLGENIADLGGVTIAYEAFRKTKQWQNKEKIDGFTPDQRFFLSWAQVWRSNTREEEAASRLVTDPHSPAIHRCNGPLSNFAPFYAAFQVKPGNKMYKPEAERAKVW